MKTIRMWCVFNKTTGDIVDVCINSEREDEIPKYARGFPTYDNLMAACQYVLRRGEEAKEIEVEI